MPIGDALKQQSHLQVCYDVFEGVGAAEDNDNAARAPSQQSHRVMLPLPHHLLQMLAAQCFCLLQPFLHHYVLTCEPIAPSQL